jgi:hypothetical protein
MATKSEQMVIMMPTIRVRREFLGTTASFETRRNDARWIASPKPDVGGFGKLAG